LEFDFEKARLETPGCRHVTHFNNAGAALQPQCVLDAVTEHQQLEARIGGYEAAERHNQRLEKVYTSIANLIGCSVDEVALVENATRAWDMAAYAIPLGPGDRVLCANAEYASNYIALLQLCKRSGATLEAIPDDAHGQVSLQALEARLDDRVKLVSLTHVPTNGGLVNPAVEVGRLVRPSNAYYLLDACQSAGQLALDVAEIDCDFLTVTGRKYLRGPRGTGFLFVRREVCERLEPPFLDLHSAVWLSTDRYEVRRDARRFECWEANLAARLGLGAAVDYALSWGLASIEKRVTALAQRIRTNLAAVPGVRVHDLGKQRCGIVSFTIDGKEPDAIRRALLDKRINVSITDRGSTLLDMDQRKLVGMIRASVHYYNTEEEIDLLVENVATISAMPKLPA